MNEWIQLANSRKLEYTYIVRLNDQNIAVYSAVLDNMRDVWKLFGDPKKTEAIHSYQYGDESDWYGFTEVTSMTIVDGTTTVCLRKA